MIRGGVVSNKPHRIQNRGRREALLKVREMLQRLMAGHLRHQHQPRHSSTNHYEMALEWRQKGKKKVKTRSYCFLIWMEIQPNEEETANDRPTFGKGNSMRVNTEWKWMKRGWKWYHFYFLSPSLSFLLSSSSTSTMTALTFHSY